MAPRRRKGAEQPRAIVAAASRVRLDKQANKGTETKAQSWQEDAWGYYDTVPEVKYATMFLGNAMAKLRLYVATMPPGEADDADPIPAADEDSGVPADVAARATDVLHRLRSNLGGQPEILRRLNMNLEVAGEGNVVKFGARDQEVDARTGKVLREAEPEDWTVCSVSELTKKGGKWVVLAGPGDSKGRELVDGTDDVFRIWQPHARWGRQADCAMRGVLDDCEALTLLTNQVKAEAKSRASAGLLLIPNELSIAGGHAPEPVEGEDPEGDTFLTELEWGLTAPISDPGAANAVVPVFVRGPAEHLEKVRHLLLGRQSEAVLDARIKARVERLARGLNLPPEVVLGHQQTTFANAEQVDQDTFDDHLHPRSVLICDALTVGFLRPLLAEEQVDPAMVDRLFVWFDPSDLVAQPDVSANADGAYDRFAISETAYRKAKGWSDDDAPDPLEVLTRAGLRRGILTADLTSALMQALADEAGVDLPEPAASLDPNVPAGDAGQGMAALLLTAMQVQRAKQDRANGNGSARMPALVAAPRLPVDDAATGRRLAGLDRDLRTRLLVLANDSMARALERAGNRLKSKAGMARDTLRHVNATMAAATLGPTLVAEAGFTDDELLAGAFDAMEQQFMAWGGSAQRDALELVGRVVGGFTLAEREMYGLRQADDLAEAWTWMRDTLVVLARAQLYDPNPAAPDVGEFDPSLRVPPGLVRQAVARAGGAAGLSTESEGDAWVTLTDGGRRPAGGVGTGSTIRDALRDKGATIKAYQWDYGPARRQRTFEPHADLDGVMFANFDDPVLANREGWPPFGFYMPGDHAGCMCDFIPIIPVDSGDS